MTGLLLALLLSACTRLPGCAGPSPEGEPPPELAPIVAPEPAARAWPHAWQWAVVVRVAPGLDAPVEVPPDQAEAGVGVGLDVVHQALAGHPVSLWEAAPGAELQVQGGAPEVAGQAFAWTVPADAAEGAWVVATDRGARTLAWGEEHVVREAFVTLGLEPWRVIVAVGADQDLGLREDAEAAERRLREHGVVVLHADGSAPVDVPWQDLPLDSVDVPALLAGATSGYVLAAQDQPARVVQADRPVRLLRDATSYFGVDLMPEAPAGAQRGKGGKARGKARAKAIRGKGAKAGKVGKAGRPVPGEGGGDP